MEILKSNSRTHLYWGDARCLKGQREDPERSPARGPACRTPGQQLRSFPSCPSHLHARLPAQGQHPKSSRRHLGKASQCLFREILLWQPKMNPRRALLFFDMMAPTLPLVIPTRPTPTPPFLICSSQATCSLTFGAAIKDLPSGHPFTASKV